MINEKWDYTDEELPWWAKPRARHRPDPMEPGIAIPADIGELITPILARILLFRIAVAATLLVTIWIGGRLAAAENSGTIIVSSCLVGFVFGIVSYLRRALDRSAAADAGAFRPRVLPPIPSPWRIVLPPLIAPLVIIGAISVYALLANRFIGLTLLVPATIGVFYFSGASPIRFMRQKYVAHIHSDRTVVNTIQAMQDRPDAIKLATFLLVAWLVPAFTSNTFGLIAVLGVCAFEAKRSFQQLVGGNQWSFFLFGVWRSGARLTREYLDYRQLEDNSWRPEETIRNRQYRAAGLLMLLDITLLVSLAYYVPWEPFAALFVPEFRTNALFVPEATMTNYRWLTAPFMLVRLADPLAGYLVCFVIAIAIYLLLPLIILYLLYIEPLTVFESIEQHISKNYERIHPWTRTT